MLFLFVMKKHLGLEIFFLFLCNLFSLISLAQIDSLYSIYLTERTHLLQQDSQYYFDKNIQLNVAELQLDQQLRALQHKMIQDYKDQHFFPPARNFYQSKKHIEDTPLFQIIRQMPKGAMLHIHGSAMGDADWIVNRAIATKEMYVFWQTDNDQYTKGQLRAFPKRAVPEGFQSARQLAKKNPDFRKELRDLLTFEEAMDQDSVDIWKEFQLIFQRIGGFVTYDKVFVDYMTNGFEILIADNVQHVEIRVPFKNTLYELGKPVDPTDMEKYLQAIEQINTNLKKIDPEFTFHIIHANLRFRDKQTIWEDIKNIYQTKREHPHWLRGYDLVAEEDDGHPTLYHAKTFLQLDSLEREHGVSLPLYLHDGESCWASVANLYDAVLLGSKRIGHGFNLFRFPTLVEQVKEKDICIEISPLSNQILGYIRDLRLHPGSTYLRRGINCSISSDDPMIFDYRGLSYDYWSIYLAWELDLAALKKLSKNGILYSAMTEQEKKEALVIWEKRWEKFVNTSIH